MNIQMNVVLLGGQRDGQTVAWETSARSCSLPAGHAHCFRSDNPLITQPNCQVLLAGVLPGAGGG